MHETNHEFATEHFGKSANSTFDLKCIGCHAGSIDGGHYFAVCKHVNNNWYEFNDKNRKLINIHSILPMVYRNSYILIYEKR